MIKRKLLAIIGGSMSVVLAATTALTLAISGPRNTMSLNALSNNDAVAYGISGMFDSATSSVNTLSQVIETISENKASLSVGFDINSIENLDELSGLGANLDINFDTDNNQYSFDVNAVYGAIELFNAVLYMDEKEFAASLPSLYDGVITIAYDNLEEDMENSFFGSVLKEQGFDINEFKEELDAVLAQAESYSVAAPDIDFTDLCEDLQDIIKKGYLEAMNNMNVTNNGKQPLNGGDYQCYTASISVADLSNIAKDVIICLLKSDEFGEYLDYIMEIYTVSALDSTDEYEDIYNSISGIDMNYSDNLKSYAPIIETYWPTIVSSIENVLGKNIAFTIYLTDTVETAGFEIYASLNSDGSINYNKIATTGAEAAVILKADFTGGKEIGDYTHFYIEELEFGKSKVLGDYNIKMEDSGDFTLDISISEEGEFIGGYKANGKYTNNDPFFTLDIDSLKYITEDITLFDIGLHISFKPIDSVTKPSDSPEYNVWDMDEMEFVSLLEEIVDNAGKIEGLFKSIFD